MGLTIAAVFVAALILPGVVALAAFYTGISTPEVRLSPPPTGTLFAFAAVGIAALAAHLLLCLLLVLNMALPALIAIPPANPYILIWPPAPDQIRPAILTMGFFGLILATLLGGLLGVLGSSWQWEWRNRLLFGWLYPILDKARPADNYINAYALTDIEHDGNILGYEGTVENLTLNEQLVITAVTLVNVSTFYLRLESQGTRRTSAGTTLRHLVLREGDFRNISLVVIRDERA